MGMAGGPVLAMDGLPSSVTLLGPALKPGDAAPEFNGLGAGLVPISLASSRGKVRLFSVVPSLDTPVCSVQTKKFNEAVAKLPQAYGSEVRMGRDLTAAFLATNQLIALSFGSGIAGTIANLAGLPAARNAAAITQSAMWLFSFAALAPLIALWLGRRPAALMRARGAV